MKNLTPGRPEGTTTTKRGRAAGGQRVNVLLSAREAGLLNADARRAGHSSKGRVLREMWLEYRDDENARLERAAGMARYLKATGRG